MKYSFFMLFVLMAQIVNCQNFSARFGISPNLNIAGQTSGINTGFSLIPNSYTDPKFHASSVVDYLGGVDYEIGRNIFCINYCRFGLR